MSLSYIRRVGGTVNTTASRVASDLDTLLQGEGPIALYDASFFNFNSAGKPGCSVVVTFRKPAVTYYRARLFTESPALGLLDAQINAFLQANDYRRVTHLLDTTPNDVRQNDPSQLIVIYTDSVVPTGVLGQSQAIILRATAPIAPGAVGFAQLVTANGPDALTAPVQVKNCGPYLWKIGFDAYAYLDPTTDADFQAFPVGCSA